MTPDAKLTVELVPLAELVRLAELGRSLRRAQEAYFQARRNNAGQCNEEFRIARDYERRFDAAVREILNQDRTPKLF